LKVGDNRAKMDHVIGALNKPQLQGFRTTKEHEIRGFHVTTLHFVVYMSTS